MGLIKAIAGAIGSTMKDQWLDLIKCDNMDMETLMVKQTTKTGQISKGSRILVAPGQVAVIYDSGAVLDATAEEGVYTFDESSSPSFFGGQFGPVFKEMWQRFTYGGTPAKEQAVFFFNAKEILDNKFGTATPIPFQDWSHAIPNQMTGSMNPMGVNVRCYGKYTFRLDDVAVFMRIHAGTGNVVKKGDITEQMRSEVIAAFFVFFGVILCFMGGLSGGGLIGDCIALLSGVTFAMVFLAARYSGNSPIDGVYFGTLVSCVFVLAVPFDPAFQLTVTQLLVMLALGLGLGLGYLFFSMGMQRGLSPVKACIISNVEPVLNPTWVALLLGQSPGLFSILGAVTVLLAITLQSLYEMRRNT